jgi:arsenate reductase-like glutaredoxin family protein
MFILTLYGRAGCPMCIAGISWLEKEGIAYTFRDIFQDPLTKEELYGLGKKLREGLFDLYAPKGARKRGLSEDSKSYSAEQIVQFQTENPDMIRYPVFDLGDRLIFGFKEETKSLLLSLLGGKKISQG